ncbi:MAG: hypothetical protein EON93_20675 [Burkholderiales bacterium]|nr:MAG: hypothetical protein EON93_20675 [Burkholderiales bacterium]
MVADAIADGSGRPVDPTVAGAMVHAAINISSDARILEMANEPDIIKRFARALFMGFMKT